MTLPILPARDPWRCSSQDRGDTSEGHTMQSIVRHDYYPDHPRQSSHSAAAPRHITPLSRLRTVAGGAAISLDRENRRGSLAWAMPASETRRVDVFRLIVAVAGLTIYLGLPAAAIAYLVFDLVG